MNEQKFAEAVKAAAQAAELDFFSPLEEGVPPASSFFQKRSRRKLYSLISLAACVCVVFGVLLAGKVGSFDDRASLPRMDAAQPVLGSKTIDWETAGDGYKDLYRLIEAQIEQKSIGPYGVDTGMEVTMDVMGAAGAMSASDEAAAEDFAPTPTVPPAAAPSADAPLGETATAGSGYAEAPEALPETAHTTQNDALLREAVAHSETNEQVAGVQEADVLKTDGEYIYGINSKNLFIVRADEGALSLTSKIAQPAEADGQVYFEMYVTEARLIAIRHGYNPVALQLKNATPGADAQRVKADGETPETCIDYPIGGWITDTSVDIFDISDRENPVRLHSLTQSGDYSDSRMIDGYLYMVTNYYGGDLSQIKAEDPRTYIPLSARDGEQRTPAPEDIFLTPGDTWLCYTVISGIDAMDTGDFVSQRSVYGNTGTLYASAGALYLTRAEYQQEEEPTGEFIKYSYRTESVLTKLALSAGLITPAAQVRVPGATLNQFSLDEYGGALRLVTSDEHSVFYNFKDPSVYRSEADWRGLPEGESTSTNALYVFDSELNQIGSVTDLAQGERVYACRFMGDVCYFVTFRQVDPLFSVDLSDPRTPTVLGALKLPGFSEYLQPYETGRLFGLGRDADTETGRAQGLKLAMFDTENPADVRLLHELIVGDEASAAEQNHKAILVSADKRLIAFPVQGRYLIYGYGAAEGFHELASVAFEGDEERSWAEIRGLFIGDIFYVIAPNQINAYAMEDAFAPVGSLRIDEGASSVGRFSYGMPGEIIAFGVEPLTPEVDTIAQP